MTASVCKTTSTAAADGLVIQLSGRITAPNADQVEEDIATMRESAPDQDVILDIADLEYISSAGLRVIMRLLKRAGNLTVRNAQPEVYDVFEMTGLTVLMDVHRVP